MCWPLRRERALDRRRLLLGDIVISLPQAIRQAREHEQDVDHELVMLLIHGVLHLCGYDHEKGPGEARRMVRR